MKTKLIIIILANIFNIISSQIDYRALYTSGLTCQMGRLQSPINLVDDLSTFNPLIATAYFNYISIANVNLAWVDNNRIVGVKASTGNRNENGYGHMGLLINGVLKQYVLKEIQINHPSEHTINGVQNKLEVQFIHDKVISFETNVNQNRAIPDANTKLIISLLYNTNSTFTDGGFLNSLTSSYKGSEKTLLNNPSDTASLNIMTNGLFEDKQFFFYEGSFTSEPCDEVANRLIIKDVFYISPSNLRLYAEINKRYKNSESTKPLTQYYGRPVYRNFANVTEASSSFLTLNLALLFALFFLIL